MKTTVTILVALLCICQKSFPQRNDVKEHVKNVNESIDNAVVRKDAEAMKKLYAPDFYFKHGTGTVDNKESWIRSVMQKDKQFISRTHDSTEVELHNDIAIISGRLTIVRMDGNNEARYGIWYIRVFRLRERNWQLISHRTTREWHN